MLVHHPSQFMVLEPGNPINPGTPLAAALGMGPPTWLPTGHTLELGIQELGTQRQLTRDPRA